MSEGDGTHVVEYSSVYMQIRVGTCLKGMGQMLWSTVVCTLHADQSEDMSGNYVWCVCICAGFFLGENGSSVLQKKMCALCAQSVLPCHLVAYILPFHK